ncbi:unnamed protein product [Lymnaea stagnalis]|uniref:Metalloendopeptidase n=1 Tax=Lymnaea stagnalis TaxID=6523 RepID=A0AAV2HP04_LYMST
MIVIYKSRTHMSKIVNYVFLVAMLFAFLLIAVSSSNASVAHNINIKNVRRQAIDTTATTERRDKFNGHHARDGVNLGKENAIERSTVDQQNVSYNLFQKIHAIKRQENVFRHKLQLTRHKTSAIRRHRRRLFMQRPEISEIKEMKKKNKQGSLLSKPPGRRRNKLNRNKRAATADKSRLWEHATIPYVIKPRFSRNDKMKIMNAMRIWENATCVTFKEKELADKDYIVFTVEPCGCCSPVGRQGTGAQTISLHKQCRDTINILHELGHAIGFHHEHSRPDRDQYVDVILENIIENKKYNFNKLKPEEVFSFGEEYDFDSIMHYNLDAGARNANQETIVPKRLPTSVMKTNIGQRALLSRGDIRQTNKLYKCASCGRTFQEDSATFSHKPTAGKSETCHWRIQAAYGQKIVLNITKLGIPRSADCVNGHLEVRDGPNSGSPRIGRFCGEDYPGVLYSSGQRMWLEYKTLRGDGLGFTAHYVTECGGGINRRKGVIASPTYDDKYLPNRNCSWNITVDPGNSIDLTFEFFDLQYDTNCEKDYLEIREGSNETDSLLGKYCGDFLHPKSIRSTGNQVFIKFVSNSAIQSRGFFISFVQDIDECNNDIHKCDQVCINTLGGYKCDCYFGFKLKSDGTSCEKGCGGVINTPNGTISSPSFPDMYPADTTCTWTIVAPKNHSIVLTFTHFDLEEGTSKCLFDFVMVYRGGGAKKYKNTKHCGASIPMPITSKGNTMKIEFKSDIGDQKSGFSAFFVSNISECAQTCSQLDMTPTTYKMCQKYFCF